MVLLRVQFLINVRPEVIGGNMSKIKNITICIIISFIIGTGTGGGLFWYFIYRPTVGGLRAELDASRADAQQYRDRAEESERRVNDVAGIITESTTTITGTISTIQQARDKIRAAIEALRKIREIIKVEELDNGG